MRCKVSWNPKSPGTFYKVGVLCKYSGMNDNKYYRDILGYMDNEDGFLNLMRLWHGIELFQDLKKIFGAKKSAECPELAEEHALYLRTCGDYENDSGMIVPIQMIKKVSSSKYILHQKDEFIFLNDLVESIHLEIAYPAKSSGYINCKLKLKSGKSELLSLFSEAMFENRDENKFFHASQQVKKLADFLQVPWKLEAFNDI